MNYWKSLSKPQMLIIWLIIIYGSASVIKFIDDRRPEVLQLEPTLD